MSRVFANREQAGHELVQALQRRPGLWPAGSRLVVCALPRGGVPVGAVLARALGCPLELLLVRKIAAPGQPELALGAVAEGTPPELLVDEGARGATAAGRGWVDDQVTLALAEIARRRQRYLHGHPPAEVAGATAIVVDDGAATGSTVRVAVQALRRRGPARIVLALPVAPAEVLAQLRPLVDEVVCLAEPVPFQAVGLHYGDFHQVEDEEVVRLLDEAARGG